MSEIVFIQKCGHTWCYLLGQDYYTVDYTPGSLFEQLIHVVSHIRDVHDYYDKHFIVCSSMLVKEVTSMLQKTFPAVSFVPIQNSGVMHVFQQMMDYARESRPARGSRVGNTLYLCSDASLSNSTLGLSGWAWVSNVGGKLHYNFGVSEQRSIVHAELEGILRAIVDNRKTRFSTIHVYCDSQRSVEWVNRLLYDSKTRESLLRTLDKRILVLVDIAREVALQKRVRVQWVRGHRTHRLNVGADYLSREARRAAARRGRLPLDSVEVQAVLEVVSR